MKCAPRKFYNIWENNFGWRGDEFGQMREIGSDGGGDELCQMGRISSDRGRDQDDGSISPHPSYLMKPCHAT